MESLHSSDSEESDQGSQDGGFSSCSFKNGEPFLTGYKAYTALHLVSSEWPCLSFDLVPRGIPDEVIFAAGSQAPQMMNVIYIIKASHITAPGHAIDQETSKNQTLNKTTLDHRGIANRIRISRHPEVFLLASWSDSGLLSVRNITKCVNDLEITSSENISKNETKGSQDISSQDIQKNQDIPSQGIQKNQDIPSQDVCVYNCTNSSEGYALSWSRRDFGHLAFGDTNGTIRAADVSTSCCSTYLGHERSVEDICWSPTNSGVFASCSCDRTIKFWDTRAPEPLVGSILAHSSDVNVIDWNQEAPHLLISGSDNGEIRAWDTRMQYASTPAVDFIYHKKPITSLEWMPKSSSMFAASCDDLKIGIWDIAAPQNAHSSAQVPPQLRFLHDSEPEVKEIHWHINTLISTSINGFTFFAPRLES